MRGFARQGSRATVQPSRRRLGALLLPLAVCVLASASTSGHAATSPFSWSGWPLYAPPGGDASLGFADVACTPSGLCVAVTADGHAFAADDAAAGPAGWSSATVDSSGSPQAVSCPTQALCAVVDSAGKVLTSVNPGAPVPSWSAHAISVDPLRAISCASVATCVAVDDAGRVLTSTDPTGGAAAWRSAVVDAAGAPLLALACPSSDLCVALDAFGDVLTSHAPADGPQAWSVEPLPGGAAPTVLSCPSSALCLALDEDGEAYASAAPADGASTWHDVGNVGLAPPAKLTCSGVDRCLAVDGQHGVAVSDAPTGGAEDWSFSSLDGALLLDGVACSAVTRCVLVDRGGRVLVGDAPAPTGTIDVTLFGEGDGTIVAPGLTCATTCSGSYPRGSRVSLTAIPAAGSVFSGWGGACEGNGTCELVVAAHTVLTAGFALAPPPTGFRLSVSIGGKGSVSGAGIACPETCATRRPPGTTDVLTARPASGWRFAGWSGGCGQHPRCPLTADSDHALIALFDPLSPRTATTVRIKLPRIFRNGTVRLRFASRPAGAALRCGLRHKGAVPRFVSCTSPMTYRRLASGRYVFLVRVGRAKRTVAQRPFTVP